jgi:hypothetical protein
MDADLFRKWLAVAGAASVIGLAWYHRNTYPVVQVGEHPILYRINRWSGDVDFAMWRSETWRPVGRKYVEIDLKSGWLLPALRRNYPQYDDLTDDQLIWAVGIKYPQYIKADSEFAELFNSLEGGTGSTDPRRILETTNNVHVRIPPYGVFSFPGGIEKNTMSSIARAIHETSLPKRDVFDIVADEANQFPSPPSSSEPDLP